MGSTSNLDGPRPAAPVRVVIGRYHIETWGCQMNVLDSDKLAGSLEREGYVKARSVGEADVILLNTCSIREKAAEKVFSELGRLKRHKDRRPGALIGVCGCVGQQEGERVFERAPFVDFVIGPRATGSLPGILRRYREGDRGARRIVDVEYRSDSIDFPFDEIRREGLGTGKAFVTVIEGCNHRCTYCVVPSTRGREICREMAGVLDEVRALAGQGILEVEFLGQTVNAYRDSAGNTLAELIRAAAEVPGIERIRFTTSHPAQMTRKLVDAMAAASPVVCPYLHLPAQSGSSSVLKRMRRGYDRAGYLEKIDALRQGIPGISFGTDLIAGFPGETDAEFDETMSLLDEVRFDQVYSFAYSPRPGTAALQLGDLSAEVKIERLERLQAAQKRIQEKRNAEWIGRVAEVLVEGRSKRNAARWSGRTAENRVVNFTGAARPGTLQRVVIEGSSAFSLVGASVISLG